MIIKSFMIMIITIQIILNGWKQQHSLPKEINIKILTMT